MIVIRNAPNIYIHGTPKFTFFPGLNTVPDSIAAGLLNDDKFKSLLKAGVMTVTKGVTGSDLAVVVGKMQSAKAVELVKACYIVDELQSVINSSVGAAVKQAATEQLAMLTEKPEAKKED